jgi:hypothetical protein
MGNKISYVKKLEGVELVMVIGYVDNGMCSLFLRNAKYDKMFDFGIVDIDTANQLFKFFDTGVEIE